MATHLGRHHLVAGSSEEAERWVEGLRAERAALPVLERPPRSSPLVGKGLLDDLVEATLLARAENGNCEAFGPIRARRRLVQVDGHPVVQPHPPIATRSDE